VIDIHETNRKIWMEKAAGGTKTFRMN